MSSQITTIAKLKIGERFSFVPSAWHGPCRLTAKTKRIQFNLEGNLVTYNIKFDSNVVNPPGGEYGIPADTKVRRLSKKPQLSRKGAHAGYVV